MANAKLVFKVSADQIGRFKKCKMRAYNPATSFIAAAVGAQPLTIQLAELPAALAAGGAENFLTSTLSGIDNKLYESVKFF